MTDDTRFYIDGAWVDRPDASRIAVYNPYSEDVIGHVAAAFSRTRRTISSGRYSARVRTSPRQQARHVPKKSMARVAIRFA